MLANKKVTVVLPAYNAAQTLKQTFNEISHDIVDDIILIDDASHDATVEMARNLGIPTIGHDRNRGYGGNQKTCYTVALARGADIVVMLHSDYQYTPKFNTGVWFMSFFGNVLHAFQDTVSAHFRLTWITLTAAAAICVAWAVGQAATSRSKGQSETNLMVWRQVGTPRGIASLALLAVFLASYVAITLVWEDFAFYDYSLFTDGTLKGENVAPPIWREEGRFFPLGYQEFNLIRHFTDAAGGYHLLPIVQLVIFAGILLILDDEIGIAARVGLAVVTLLTPSILISFNALTATERNVLFFLACLLLSVKRFEQTQSTAWAVVAAVCAQIMIYYKETAFLLLLGFAVGRLILRCRNGHNERWDYHRLWDKEGVLDLCLASLAALFLVYYLAVMGIHGNMSYADRSRQPLAAIAFSYLRRDLLACVFVAVVLVRIYLILRRRAAPLPLWDGLAFGGVACLVGYLYLGMFAANYPAPVDFIAVLYVGRFAFLRWKETHSWSKVTALLLTFTVLLQNIFFSTFAVFERKNGIHAKVEIARLVKTQYQNRAGNPVRLFFPFANPYVIMEFGYYLSYRGVPVEDAEGESPALDDVLLASATIGKDGPCVRYKRIRCHSIKRPAPGDLVIVLPDDEASLAEASVYRERQEVIFFYQPRPPLPRWLHSVIAGWQVASARSSHDRLPDRWMDGSVTIWR